MQIENWQPLMHMLLTELCQNLKATKILFRVSVKKEDKIVIFLLGFFVICLPLSNVLLLY